MCGSDFNVGGCSTIIGGDNGGGVAKSTDAGDRYSSISSRIAEASQSDHCAECVIDFHSKVSLPILLSVLPIKIPGISGAAEAGGNIVYQATSKSGDVIYVGITNNLERRAAQHLGSRGISIDAVPGLTNLSRADARAAEQVLIEHHGLARNGGTLMNMINSIATRNPIYSAAIKRGTALLRNVGYPGF